jgi:hypothetical protein
MVTPRSREAQDFIRAWQEGTTLPPFISRAICKPWDKPIPGPSLIKRNADRQTRDRSWPEDTGSLHMPPIKYASAAIAPCMHVKHEDQEARMAAEEVQKAAALAELEDLDMVRANLRRSIELGNFATDLLMQRLASGDAQTAQAAAEPVNSRAKPMPEDACAGTSTETNPKPEVATDETATHGRVFGMPRARVRASELASGSKPLPENTDAGNASDASPNSEAAADAAANAKATPTPAQLAAGTAELEHEFNALIERGQHANPHAAMEELSDRDLLAVSAKGNQCAWILARVAVMRRKAADNLVAAAMRANRKTDFYDSRARAILGHTFLAMEDTFRNVGFGGWMPFRYCDQWLAFSDLMQRLFAANGLMAPNGPNHWARFIRETPPVPIEEFPQAPLKMPEGMGPTKKHREINDFDELVERARGAPQ